MPAPLKAGQMKNDPTDWHLKTMLLFLAVIAQGEEEAYGSVYCTGFTNKSMA